MLVELYRAADAPAWNAFVRSSRNGTFQHNRDYMDYHRDRFVDHSLMVRDLEGRLVAILPAHRSGSEVASHNGLTFGGMIYDEHMKTPMFLQAFEALLLFLQHVGASTLHYRATPYIYHRQPADEDSYALFLLSALLTRRDLLSVIDRGAPRSYQARRLRGIKKATAAGVIVHQEDSLSDFWPLLTVSLAQRHAAAPVHTLKEIELLRERFPASIRLHTARTAKGDLLAGVVVYLSNRVTHAQYIASSPEGRDLGALDLLFDTLISDETSSAQYFDFGSSHEEAGRVINRGLIDQKEGFGARSVSFDRYRIDLTTVRPGILTGALR